ncbi:MAG: UbiX family flavin prenyltransferase [Deltaproteobacteria bacterium]|nr:UbiX family flavin prenyltransferase [Deltaproteobacteria bacterium]
MKIIIGITGASGAIYPFQLLTFLREKTNHDVSLIASPNGRRIFKEELEKDLEMFDYPIYGGKDFDVPFVSGSARYDQLVIVPCSMGTMGRIAHGVSDDTLTRTADVFIKEKRKMIVVPRETPFSLIHIENMRLLLLAGVTIIPAIPSFYSRPQTIEQTAATVTSRILDHMGIENNLMERWKK